MIHTTRYANANRTVVLDQVDLIVAPTKVQGDWIIQIVFRSGHVTSLTYELGQFQTPQTEIENNKADMFTDYEELLSAMIHFHDKHGLV
jgi:hypothetical protein